MHLDQIHRLFCLLLVSVLHAHAVDQETSKKQVSVNVNRTSCVRVGLPHMKGLYVKKGSVKLRIKAGDDVRVFEIEEDLSLVAVHFLPPIAYLIFDPNVDPERGFLAFKADRGKPFERVKLSELPQEVIAPNFGAYASETDVLLKSKEPLDDAFFDTWAARLWSQIATGKESVLWGIDREKVLKIWQAGTWKKSLIETQIRKE